MILKRILLAILLLANASSFAQIETGIYDSTDKKYDEIIDELGNPLPGTPVVIAKIFVPDYGSYVWYLNESKSKNRSFLYENPKDLYAGIFVEDHGGLLAKITFKDFAEDLVQPRYLINFCEIVDADKDGFPEFYLTYFQESDGLDAKPLKVIVYTKKGKDFLKSKITAWIPFQPEDKYREVEDANFKSLPRKVQLRAENILKKAKGTVY